MSFTKGFTICVLLFPVWAFNDDQFYCRAVPGKYKICKKCPNFNESCGISDVSTGCHCDNIEIAIEKGTANNFQFQNVKICAHSLHLFPQNKNSNLKEEGGNSATNLSLAAK